MADAYSYHGALEMARARRLPKFQCSTDIILDTPDVRMDGDCTACHSIPTERRDTFMPSAREIYSSCNRDQFRCLARFMDVVLSRLHWVLVRHSAER
jgi:hypothetical protein